MSTCDSFGVPVVIWNNDDAESMALRGEFIQRIESLYPGNVVEPISRVEDLRSGIGPLVKSLQNKIRHKLASKLASTGSPPPRISPNSSI
jgi:hypothetical protein